MHKTLYICNKLSLIPLYEGILFGKGPYEKPFNDRFVKEL